MEFKPGLYPGISRSTYESITACNHSFLKNFRRTPAHAREYMLHPPKPTEAMQFGTALHMAVLEPDKFVASYVVPPKVDRRTTVGKNTWAQFELDHRGKELIEADDYLKIAGMRAAIWEHDLARSLIQTYPGKNEMCVLWNDPVTGMPCKCLQDRMTTSAGWTVVVDLKTCENASEWNFGYDVNKFCYHSQAAYYLWGPEVLAPLPRKFVFVAVEKKPPFAVAVYELDESSLNTGKQLIRKWLDQYHECQKTGIWTGYPRELQTISIPGFALNTGEEDGVT